MDVKSKPGTRCPMEGKPRTYIGDAEAVTVPDTAYYLRLVAEGSLIEEVPESVIPAQAGIQEDKKTPKTGK